MRFVQQDVEVKPRKGKGSIWIVFTQLQAFLLVYNELFSLIGKTAGI
jgi:hypothetical protein